MALLEGLVAASGALATALGAFAATLEASAAIPRHQGHSGIVGGVVWGIFGGVRGIRCNIVA